MAEESAKGLALPKFDDTTSSMGKTPSMVSKSPSMIGKTLSSRGPTRSSINPTFTARKSHRMSAISNLLQDDGHGSQTGLPTESTYTRIISEARRCIDKHGSQTGAFAEEWSAQLLVDCGSMHVNKGRRLVIFTPAILQPILGDECELDRAFKFVLLAMDRIALHGKYDFVYCHSGSNLINPELAHRFRIAYDILPREYARNLGTLYILHPSSGLRLSLMTSWLWITKRLWKKIHLYPSMDGLCEALNIGKDVRRRFPHLVHHTEAVNTGIPPPLAFGSSLEWLCDTYGVDFVDRTTGRRYPLLPSALICLCEALERHDADRQFALLFTGKPASAYDCVSRLDVGLPLDPDTPLEVLWCTLKLFLDCMPAPLLSFDAFTELQARNITVDDIEAQRDLLLEIMHKWLPMDVSYVTLYLASFLHTMVNCSEARAEHKNRMSVQECIQDDDDATASLPPTMCTMKTDRKNPPLLTAELVAQAFAPSFLRPRDPTAECMRHAHVAVALMQLLVSSAEDPSFWIGKAPSSMSPSWDFPPEANAEPESEGDSEDLG